MTSEQHNRLNSYKNIGRRLLTHFMSADNIIIVTTVDNPDQPEVKALFREKFNTSGNLLSSAIYPNVLTPNISAL